MRRGRVRGQGEKRSGSPRGDPPNRAHPQAERRPKGFSMQDQARLYELIWLRAVASQMESAELERTTIDITAKVASRAPRTAGDRNGGEVRWLPHPLSGGAGTKIRTTRRRADCRKMSAGEPLDQALDRRDPAFYRAAAPLFRGVADQTHGRTRHRPAVDLCLDHAGAQGPQICAARQEAAVSPRTARRIVVAFLESFFTKICRV